MPLHPATVLLAEDVRYGAAVISGGDFASTSETNDDRMRPFFLVLYPVIAVLTAALAPPIQGWLLPLLIAAIAALPHWLAGLRRVTANPVEAKPREPRQLVPRMRAVEAEPPSTILLPSDRCSICGRTLTNPTSQLARVGMECIKTHGPRYLHGPNPAHAAWRADLARAEADLAAARATAKVQYKRDLEERAAALTAWERQCQHPAIRKAMGERSRGRRTMMAAGCGAATAWSSYLATTAFL